MELYEAIKIRRSTRMFDRERLPDDAQIARCFEAAGYAPSAMNSQSKRFFLIRSRDALQELNTAVEGLVDEATRTRILSRTPSGIFNFHYGSPMFVLMADTPTAFEPKADCSMAMQNFMLAAEAEGLATCYINQAVALCDNPALKEVYTSLGVPEDYRIYAACAFGYKAAETPLTINKVIGYKTV